WQEEWDHIVFSDESRLCLWRNDGRVRVRRFRGERQNLRFALRGHTGQTPGVMVWGVIAVGARSRLVFIQGALNGLRYIDEILEPVLLDFLDGLPGYIFQQNNARPHIANVSRRFLEESLVPTLPWPARP